MSAIEAVYIYDHLAPGAPLILQHCWRRATLPAATLMEHYTAHAMPRPSLMYLRSTIPPTLLFSIVHNNLLVLSPQSSEMEPLLVLEFLRRVVDVLEDYLGAPLLGSKIEANYDIVAQLLGEMADGGLPFMTEPNALRDVVLPPSLMGKLLGSVTGLPSSTLASSFTPTPSAGLSAVPWRRANVKHTSNELFVDVLELLHATIAPSGRALAARVSGSIAFTSKLSGVPDLLLTLQSPTSHKQTLGGAPNAMLKLPVFHPCVRLARWRDRPGELSFIPPDGKFVLASYEADLPAPNAPLPVTVELATALGPRAEEFECRVFISTQGLTRTENPTGAGGSAFGSRSARASPAFGASASAPAVEDVTITLPLPPRVKTLVATRCSRGEFIHEGPEVVWRVPTTGAGAAASATATLRSAIILQSLPGDNDDDDESADSGDDDLEDYKPGKGAGAGETEGLSPEEKEKEQAAEARKQKRREKQLARLKSAMPRCAIVKFSVKGWLASGVRVDSLKIMGGKGLGEGVKPYKGVKYITRSEGIEIRC